METLQESRLSQTIYGLRLAETAMLLLLSLFLLASCGGGGGASTVKTGKFIDAPVQGLDYLTDSQNGITDSQGNFRYEAGEEITFSIGDVVLGTTLAKPIITPLDLVNNAQDETDPIVTNILRFLQSLDDDGDLEDTITITPQITTEVSGRPINFNTSVEEFDNAEMADLFEALNDQDAFSGNIPRELRKAEEAQEHFRKELDEPSGPTELVALFSITPESAIVLEPVTFDASGSTGAISEYVWDFGDGETGTGIEETHTFTEIDTYLVTLTVVDENGGESSTIQEIIVNEPPNELPIAQFTPKPTAGQAPIVISFVPTGSSDPDGEIVQYFWDFDDGENAIGRVAHHAYDEPGNYVAKLTVTDNDGATAKAIFEIIITGPPPNQAPTASFTATPETGEAPLQVAFNGSASADADGSITSHSWSFGDGQSGSGATTNHTYQAEGDYQVTLIVTDNDGATAEHTKEINVTPSTNELPNASFTTIPSTGGAPLNVSFNGSASTDPDGTINQYNWDFGDGQTGSGVTANHIYAEPDTYQAKLTVTDDMGATAETTRDIIVTDAPNQSPIAAIGLNPSTGSAPLKVTCIGTGSSDPDGFIIRYEWDFGDGKTGSGSRKVHTYSEPGIYSIILTVTDDDGARDTKVLGIRVTEHVNQSPSASFSATPNTGEAPLDVLFDATASKDSDGVISQYSWDFGDGQVDNSNNRRPDHTYNIPGNYPVQLTVTDNDGATASTSRTVIVLEQTNQPPNASITATPATGAAPLAVFLEGTGSTDADGTITEYFWELGDGTTATTSSVNITYNVANTYRVRLTVTDDEGATDTISRDISVTAPRNYSISGVVLAPDNTASDSDVNDPFAPYTSNDSEGEAQELPNPVVLGGYTNVPGTGPSGRSQLNGDEFDYYLVDIATGQQITLNITDPLSDLDLSYINNDTGETDLSAGTNQIESLTAPSSGSYTITVQALSGASNYTLTIAQATANGLRTSQAIGSLHLNAEFKPGDIIVRFREDEKSVGRKTLAARAAATGLKGKRGKAGRPMLLGIESDNRARAFKALGVKEKRRHPVRDKADTIKQHKIDTIEAIKALRKRPDVLYAEPNYARKPMAVPNDSHYGLQWHYPFINLPQAWDITTGSNSVIVAVIDTGVLLNHPDLLGQLTPGYDFISGISNANDGDGIDPNPDDPGDQSRPDGSSSFHGTHVAGTIAARTNNNAGVAGIAWNTNIMPLRVLGREGGWSFDLIEALKYAAGIDNDSGTVPANPADIINLSLGGEGSLQSEQDFFNELHDVHNIIVIASAGNDSSSTLFYPASYNNVVSVSAVDASGSLAYYSNFGSRIDVAAPGGGDTPDINGDGYYDGVLSTAGDDTGLSLDYVYAFFQGTSMAAPHVAGVAALMKAVYPGLTPQEFDNLLASGTITEDLGSPGRDNQFGFGLIDAFSAVSEAQDLAGGGSSTPANLVINPTSLNFGSAISSINLIVQNTGTESLQVGTPTADETWLTVTPSSVDADGLGTYTATVNRSSLAGGTYTATITFPSTANDVDVNVIMQVQTVTVTGDLGRLYILLLDPDTLESDPDLQTAANVNNGVYSFSISNIPAGTYLLYAGSDPNNDFLICDDGEACGAYLTLEQPTILTVDRDMTGLDFSALFNVNVTLGSQAVGDGKEFLIRRNVTKSLIP
jgi:serine protease